MTGIQDTLTDLLDTAFRHLAGVSPTVVASAAGSGGRDSGTYTLPTPMWPRQDADRTSVSTVASSALAAGPVLLLPDWSDDGVRGLKAPYPFEDQVLGLTPPPADCVLAIVLPAVALASNRGARFRAAFRELWQPVLIIETTGVLDDVHSAVSVSVVFAIPRGETWRPLKIFRLRRGVESANKEFSRLLSMGGGELADGYVVRDNLPPDVSLGFERHRPSTLARQADLSRFGSAVPLRDIFDVSRGRPIPILRSQPPGRVRILGGKDVLRNGAIAVPDQPLLVDVPDDWCLRTGDIVIRGLHRSADAGSLPMAEVTADDLPLVAGSHVLILRAHPGAGRRHRQFAALFLRSIAFRSTVDAFGKGGLHVDVRAVGEIKVPLPDEELTTALDDLDHAAGQFDMWESEATGLLESVFDSASAADSRRRIIETGRTLRLRAEAASLLDDLGHTVRTRFPHPVAYRWRRAEVEASLGATHDAYEAVLDTAEVLICYCASVGLLMARLAGLEVGAVGAIRDKLASGRTGPGLGDWVSVLREVCTGKQFRRLPETIPLGEIRTVLQDDEADAARKRLAGRRNDQAHLRRIDPGRLPEAIGEATADLRLLLERALVLADLPLVHIRSAAWNAFTTASAVKYTELMGDHAVVPAKRMEVTGQHLEEGSLYMLDAERRAHLLRPFLIGGDCPLCGVWSTFAPDTAPDGQPVYKSLEHGHTREEPGLAAPLSAVGLLP